MIHIGLKSLILNGYHGIHPEERVLGGKFKYNIQVGISEVQGCKTDAIEDTVDYTQLVQIIKENNASPQNLLEFLSQSIIEDIGSQFPEVEEITLEIEKIQAPIADQIDSVYVKNTWKKV